MHTPIDAFSSGTDNDVSLLSTPGSQPQALSPPRRVLPTPTPAAPARSLQSSHLPHRHAQHGAHTPLLPTPLPHSVHGPPRTCSAPHPLTPCPCKLPSLSHAVACTAMQIYCMGHQYANTASSGRPLCAEAPCHHCTPRCTVSVHLWHTCAPSFPTRTSSSHCQNHSMPPAPSSRRLILCKTRAESCFGWMLGLQSSFAGLGSAQLVAG